MSNQDPRRQAPVYLAHVVPGLEEIASGELGRLEGISILQVLQHFDERTSLILFRYDGLPADLLSLGTIEDVFVLVVRSDAVPASWRGVDIIRSGVAAQGALERAMAVAMRTRPRRTGKMTFRVIARKAGTHAFRRVDMQRAVERGILDRFPGWRLVEDDARYEIWAHLIGGLLVVGMRLSDNALRHRTYRRVSLPASLKPTIARAMVLLSQPRPDDVFLDPMCGSGTILIERALAARYRLLLGGDADPEAVRATLDNVGPRYKPIEIRRWDARRLPLEPLSVSTIVTNMPFGRQIGTAAENERLYPALLDEWNRVLQPGGRMALLTSERSLLRRALQAHTELVLGKEHRVLVRGLRATIHVIRKA